MYAADGYQSKDDGWSPGEYFSPEGIKGKWAGQRPDGRAGGRGHRDDGRGDPGADYDSYQDGFDGAAYADAGRGQGGERPRGAGAPRGSDFPAAGDSPQDGYAGYGADEYASGAYDLPSGADEVRPERGRRWRKDREDRTDWTGILRLRRDKGEDIWPDDGISDEDYWASVSADQPLNGAEVPDPDDRRAPGAARRPGAGPRAGAAGTDAPFGDQRGEKPRGVTGRLGPPPGLADDYQPGGTPAGGLPGGPGQPGGNGGPGFGWMSAGSAPARSGTGPTPTVGVTSSRPPASQNGMRPGSSGASGSGPNAGWSPAARPGTGSGGFPGQPPARPSFQPNGYQPGSGPAGGRPQDRGDVGERTERIDRVNASGSPVGGRPQDRGDVGERTERIDRVDASGYPDPRAASRSQGPGLPGSSSQPMGFGPSFTGSAPSAPAGTPARGRADGDPRQAPDRRDAGRRDAEGRDAGRREADRDGSRETGSIWSIPARPAAPGAGDDDPLTSTAYSRSALAENDGRSYRTAARLSQAQAKLTDQTDPFASGPYPQGQHNGRTGDYPAASYQQAEQRSGEYRQHRSDASAAPTPAPGGRYPSYGSQPGQGQAGPSQGQRPGQGPAQGQPGQPGRGAAGTGRPGAVSGPGPSVPGSGLPSGGLPGRQYESQHSRPSQPQRQQGQPPAAPLAAPVYSGNSAPAAGSAPSGGPAGAPGGGGPADGRQAGTGGLNPYDGTTGSYPYAAQPYPNRPAAPTGPVPAGPGRDGDDRYRRPAPQDGYARGNTDQNRGDQSRAGQNGDDPNRNGYGAGYGSNWPASRERPY